jgi:hypothetical protein
VKTLKVIPILLRWWDDGGISKLANGSGWTKDAWICTASHRQRNHLTVATSRRRVKVIWSRRGMLYWVNETIIMPYVQV